MLGESFPVDLITIKRKTLVYSFRNQSFLDKAVFINRHQTNRVYQHDENTNIIIRVPSNLTSITIIITRRNASSSNNGSTSRNCDSSADRSTCNNKSQHGSRIFMRCMFYLSIFYRIKFIRMQTVGVYFVYYVGAIS